MYSCTNGSANTPITIYHKDTAEGLGEINVLLEKTFTPIVVSHTHQIISGTKIHKFDENTERSHSTLKLRLDTTSRHNSHNTSQSNHASMSGASSSHVNEALKRQPDARRSRKNKSVVFVEERLLADRRVEGTL